MGKLIKEIGAEEVCPICDEDIICVEKPASGNYPAKLQWQNIEGGAHYNYDFATKTTTCGKPTIETKQSNIIPLVLTMPKTSDIDTKVLERMRIEAKVLAQQNIAKLIGVNEACNESGIDNPAMRGMIFNSVVNNG